MDASSEDRPGRTRTATRIFCEGGGVEEEEECDLDEVSERWSKSETVKEAECLKLLGRLSGIIEPRRTRRLGPDMVYVFIAGYIAGYFDYRKVQGNVTLTTKTLPSNEIEIINNKTKVASIFDQ